MHTLQSDGSDIATSDANYADIGESARLTSLVQRLSLFEDTAGAASLGVLRRRIESYVQANLDRADLTIGRIAERMGCSPRYVHRAFDAEDCTPADYIWQARLRRARDRLTSSEAAGRSISDVAFSVGFSSSAHFSRAFRARYDISPSEFRRRIQTSA